MTLRTKHNCVRTGKNSEAAGTQQSADSLTDLMSYSTNRTKIKTIKLKIARNFRMATVPMASDACLSTKQGVNKN